MPRSVVLGHRWSAMASGIAVCLLTYAGCQRDPQPNQGPNVLLITLDTTRADRLGCYGCTKPISANLDGLAERGVVFTRAVAQAAVTPVSHASILTGQNPYTHGLRVLHGIDANRLGESCVTLAEVLEAAGYRTAAFVSAFPVTRRFGLHQGFETFDAEFLHDSPQRIVSPSGIVNTGRNQRGADETTDLALTWLRQTPEPFFLWLHYFDPHDVRLLPPGEFMSRYPITAGDLKDRLRAVYDIEVCFMDRHIGRVLDQLLQSGRFDKTIIVAVADHGEGLGDHDWWTHGILYEEQIRVPLILCGPSIPTGRRNDFVVRTIDIMPTILELTDVSRERFPPMEGHSLVPLLGDGAIDPDYRAYADSVNMLMYNTAAGMVEQKDEMLFAVTDGRWKYVHHALRPSESELYNLKDDPHELANLRDSHPEQVARLLADLQGRKCAPAGPVGREPMSEEDRRRLRSLGYVP